MYSSVVFQYPSRTSHFPHSWGSFIFVKFSTPRSTQSKCRTFFVHHASIGWLKQWAFMNIPPMWRTELVFQFPKGWSKETASQNIRSMLQTLLVCHLFIGRLNEDAPRNIEPNLLRKECQNVYRNYQEQKYNNSRMLVTLLVSQPPMCWSKETAS